MPKIVAIGGGDIRTKSTLSIDRAIIKLTNRSHPHFLFIPTASSDNQQYSETIQKYYKQLGCTTDVLYLLNKHFSFKETAQKIEKADIIYVGGGNTLKMMRLWRHLGIDTLLKAAWRNGTVVCGISAGAICWFTSGHSDSMSFYNPKEWKYINVKGLNLQKSIFCPHFNDKTLGIPRKKHFEKMIAKKRGLGLAVDNNCALAIIGDTFRIIRSKKDANAYCIFTRKSKVISEKILQKTTNQPLSELYSK
ncbi:MAG: hypothetical protein A2912_00585 [Candidatus Buchananbacteria bacterium RIFCSPLOWO2_01_FULL_40_23b]|uniref:Peptidase E n=1 Tax=Candidatus Buchananbacteria bacterium RIFCSPLOWO2_01_FULL_40_23b TaxID=1797544 RepID=A0A1G1YVY4_9BACT|nr:MAG: hypothetical protein A2912_00585 [Candidatus Buchananbacteria bacterium RIFCSPLOWO2_01_FULL_40_23b]